MKSSREELIRKLKEIEAETIACLESTSFDDPIGVARLKELHRERDRVLERVLELSEAEIKKREIRDDQLVFVQSNLPPCGMIFEFKEMDQAKAFAAAVKTQFDLDSRIFDDAAEAARSHAFPWVQEPPVVHVDRPHWKTGANDETIGIERQIEELAGKFGGKFVGT